MLSLIVRRSFSILGVSCILAVIASASAQSDPAKTPTLVIKKPETAAIMIDAFGTLTAEHRSARLDAFLQDLSQNPGSVGYVFLYCGKRCRYGEIEAHQRGIEIKIALRNFDRSRLVVLNAGFRDEFSTELWLVPQGIGAPRPKSTVNIRFVEFSKSTGRTFEAYDCCDDFSETWKNIKP